MRIPLPIVVCLWVWGLVDLEIDCFVSRDLVFGFGGFKKKRIFVLGFVPKWV